MMYTFDIVIKDYSDKMPYNIVQSHFVDLVKGRGRSVLSWSPLFILSGFRVYGQKELLEKIKKDIRRLARGKIKFSVTSSNPKSCTQRPSITR